MAQPFRIVWSLVVAFVSTSPFVAQVPPPPPPPPPPGVIRAPAESPLGVVDRDDPDKTILRRGKYATDDAAIQKLLRDRPDLGERWAELPKLVQQLASDQAATRTDAADQLKKHGAAAVVALRDAESLLSTDEAKQRARTVRYAIEQTEAYDAHDAAARLLIRRNPPEAAPALLHYLPFTFDPDTEETLWYALERLATKDPKILATLETLLANPAPARRAFAGCLLARHGNATQQTQAKKLLDDPAPIVRLRTAQGFLARCDKTAVPTLLALLVGPPIEIRWQAEELLRWASATEEAPTVVLGAGEAKASQACQEAWQQWWGQHAKTLDLAAVDQVACRPLLLLAFERSTGRVWLVGSDGVPRHEWMGYKMLEDARYVPGGTVLTLEGQPVRADACLAERDCTNAILWKNTNLRDPKHCQRLANGTVFVAELQTIKPHFYYQIVAPGGQRVAGRPDDCAADWRTVTHSMTPDGKVVASLYPALFESDRGFRFASLQEYDPTTNTVRNTMSYGDESATIPRVELTPTYSYLVANMSGRNPLGYQRILEYDFNGKIAWEYKVNGATHTVRCLDGNTVACVGNRFIELTPDKRWLAEITLDANVSEAHTCMNLVRVGFKAHATRDILLEPDFRLRQIATRKQSLRLAGLRGLRDNLGPRPRKEAGTIPALEKFANDPDLKVRAVVKQTLIEFGQEEIPRLVAQMQDPDVEKRRQAMERMIPYKSSGAVIDALLKATADKEQRIRVRAIALLWHGQYDPQQRFLGDFEHEAHLWAAPKIVPTLIELTKDRDAKVAQQALYTLRSMGLQAKDAAPIFKKIIESDAPANDRYNAIVALSHVSHDEASRIYINAILKEKKEPQLRAAAAYGLAHFGPKGIASLEAIIEAFCAKDVSDSKQQHYIQSACLSAFSTIAPTDRRVIILLQSELKNELSSTGIRLDCAFYLAKFDSEYQATRQYLLDWFLREKDRDAHSAIRDQLRQSRRPLFKD